MVQKTCLVPSMTLRNSSWPVSCSLAMEVRSNISHQIARSMVWHVRLSPFYRGEDFISRPAFLRNSAVKHQGCVQKDVLHLLFVPCGGK